MLRRLLVVVTTLVVCFVVCEGLVRVIGHVDQDGNFVVRSRRVRPYLPPATSVQNQVANYLSAESFVAYDPELGWAPRPGATSRNGLYHYNSAGLRVGDESREYGLQPTPDVLRIAIFGDSFTHGDDVPSDASWGALLEQKLCARGKKAEVLNFGVFAYGMDQAFLRWRKAGSQYHPNVVIFGFQAENAKRNQNILRPLLWWGAEFPFSKPRFALHANELRLVNVPAVPPDQVPDVLEHLETWSLRDQEAFYHPGDYRSRFWSPSRFVSLVVDVVSDRGAAEEQREIDYYRIDGDPARLTLRIIQEFAESVAAAGAKFWIVHLPTNDSLATLSRKGALPYAELMRTIAGKHPWFETTDAMLGGAIGELFVSAENGHYSRAGNEVVAEVLASALANPVMK